jgi:hypothetical protein
MDSTVDVLSEQHWGKSYTEIHDGYIINSYHRGAINMPITFHAQFMIVKDSDKCYWKRGDIIRFSSGFNSWKFDHIFPWKKWFLKKKDYLKALQESEIAYSNPVLPKYARLEYGMILCRYKWNKTKDHGTFRDYGSIIMMLTGSKPGRIRRYYIKNPYELVSRYPYDHIIPFNKKKGLKQIPEISRIKEVMSHSSDKDNFILNMIESFNV